ncbi:hypothetical protein Lfu02_48230 [Longispora fulva]|uniref:DUF2332 domain-containing protein n=1 Tax=Longispora fulva TaxID=619741 RepID=A0A8J7KKJ3_9ACTN|nr:DUF2332 family protein [Longispora fulva]MBG6138199.1 hypothetical protein [Longispora fulva]GIG60451.1 hypothetical protein Lfu02_48230 [Longispora fulva]
MTETPTLAAAFTRAADGRFTMAGSPRLAALARAVAADPGLGAPVAALGETLPGHPPLLFAAVQCVLRTVRHPLADYYPTLGGHREPGPGMVEAFADLVATHGGLLAELCAARPASRTNDPGIAAITRPALGRAAAAAGGRPVALLELGAAAGLALLPDLYRYSYRGAGSEVVAGAGAVTLECELRGPVPDHLDTDLDVALRIGLERDPVLHDDPDAVRWLLSGVYPERTAELARLTAGLAGLDTHPVDWRVGDFLDELPKALADVPADVLPVVYGSSVLCCLDRRAEFPGLLAAAGRDLVWISKEQPENALALVSDEPNPFSTEHCSVLTSVTYTAGEVSEVVALAEVDPWVRWLDWRPTVMRPRSAG